MTPSDAQATDDPEEVFEIIKESIGDAFTLVELLRVIYRVFTQKPIHIFRRYLTPDVTGRTYSLLDAVVIHLNARLDPDHALCVCCHEIGHVIFNHVKLTELTLEQFLIEEAAGRIDQLSAAYRQHKTVFDIPQEQATEDLGLLLIEALERGEATLPDLAQDIYGSD